MGTESRDHLLKAWRGGTCWLEGMRQEKSMSMETGTDSLSVVFYIPSHWSLLAYSLNDTSLTIKAHEHFDYIAREAKQNQH